MAMTSQMTKAEVSELVDRRVSHHRLHGWFAGLCVVLLLPGVLAFLLMFALGARTAVAAGLVVGSILYFVRAVRVDRREFQRNLLWEQILRSGEIVHHSFQFRRWFYAEEHSSEYLFVVEAQDGRWFHVVSEDVYYFMRDGVPDHWTIRVCPATCQVLEVQGATSDRLVEPLRIALPTDTVFDEFGEYRSFDDMPLLLREAVTTANKRMQATGVPPVPDP